LLAWRAAPFETLFAAHSRDWSEVCGHTPSACPVLSSKSHPFKFVLPSVFAAIP